jgi:hypothetical protein
MTRAREALLSMKQEKLRGKYRNTVSVLYIYKFFSDDSPQKEEKETHKFSPPLISARAFNHHSCFISQSSSSMGSGVTASVTVDSINPKVYAPFVLFVFAHMPSGYFVLSFDIDPHIKYYYFHFSHE